MATKIKCVNVTLQPIMTGIEIVEIHLHWRNLSCKHAHNSDSGHIRSCERFCMANCANVNAALQFQ